MMYVLKYNEKYVLDFGCPEPILTNDINKAAIWFTKREITKNARENGFKLGKNYTIVACGLHELSAT